MCPLFPSILVDFIRPYYHYMNLVLLISLHVILEALAPSSILEMRMQFFYVNTLSHGPFIVCHIAYL